MPLLKYLQEAFHLRRKRLEAFRVMPFVQLCKLNRLGIFMFLGLYVFVYFEYM